MSHEGSSFVPPHRDPDRTVVVLYAWRFVGGSCTDPWVEIRCYRLQDQPIPAGDTGAAGNSSTPPPASGSGTEDEESGDPCLSQAEDLDGDIEASGSSGGVFLDSAASGSDPSEDQSNSSHYVPTWRRGSESPPPRSTKTASP